ncbi:MAG: insulinase family protein [Candidatus Melainabacteria bacterium]|nr:insulinase family protein [Candidatus Melainabacteria bacterium]
MIIPTVDRFHYVGVAPFSHAGFLTAEVSKASESQIASKAKPVITTLDNGLTIVTQTNPTLYSAGVNVFVHVGSVNENEHNSGATHFLEHMVFKRTKSRSGKEIAEEAENSGASINAATSEDHTFYHTQALGENIMAPTLVYLDMLLNNKMLQKEFDIEKGVILEEAKGYEDDPTSRAMHLAQETYCSGHPYGKRVIGTQSTISGMQRSDLKRFLTDFYTPDNMIVSLAGNFDVDAAIRQIDDFTSSVTRKTIREEVPLLTYNVQNANDSMNIQQSHVVLMSKGYSLLDDKRYALAGRKGAIFMTMTDPIADMLTRLRNAYQAAHKDVDMPSSRMKEEIAKLSAYSNGVNYMERGEILPIEEVDRKIRAVTNEDIMQVAREIFDPAFMAAYVVGPKKFLPKNVDLSV